MEKASRSIPAIAATIDSDRSAGFKGSFLSWRPTNSSRTALSRPERTRFKRSGSSVSVRHRAMPTSSKFISQRSGRTASRLQQAGRRESLRRSWSPVQGRPRLIDERSKLRAIRVIAESVPERRTQSARFSAGLNPLLERLGRPDVVAIEVDELPGVPHLSENGEKTC